MSLKEYSEANGIPVEKLFNMVVGEGGNILPTKGGFTGYIAEIRESSIVCVNDKLNVNKEIPILSFQGAEFGIGNGLLWLQCRVDGSPFVFCMTRKEWKSEAGRLLLEKIGTYTEILGMKDYKGYTGKLFFLYLFK